MSTGKIEKLESVKVKGGCFKEETNMRNLLKSNITVVYGKNGSGKSTIARGIYQSAEIDKPEVIVDYGFEIDEDFKRKIYVYNEEFIEKTVRFQKDGLKTMVMLGEQNSLNESLANIRLEVSENKNKRRNIEEKINAITEKMDLQLKSIRRILQVNNGWADRDRLLRKRKVNSPINKELLERMFTLCQKDSFFDIEDTRKNIEEGIRLLGNLFSAQEIDVFYMRVNVKLDEQELQNLCRKKVEASKLNERDKKIVGILTTKYNYLNNAKEYFSDKNHDICPYCLRDVTSEDREDICRMVNLHLENEVEIYRAKLESALKEISNIDEICENASLSKIVPELYIDAKNYRLAINKKLLQIKDIISNRLNDLYGDFSNVVIPSVSDLIASYNATLEKLNEKIDQINRSIRDGKSRIESLIESNIALAAWENREEVIAFHSLNAKLDGANSELQANKEETRKKEERIDYLVSEIKNTRIPAEYMNSILSFVFFDKERLSLKYEDGIYKLLVNGNQISPEKVSVGERNAIALSYFFATIGENHKINDVYQEPSLIVLDDPVSSFDYDNRVGILSALRWQMNTALEKCSDTRFLIFSHDFATVQDLSKLTQDILDGLNAGKKKSGSYLYTRKYSILSNFLLTDVDNQKLEEVSAYKDLIQQAYSTATSNSDSEFISLSSTGNALRKILEAYSTFLYRKGPSDVIRDIASLSVFNEDEKKFYQNCMSRLILNSDSHMREDAQALILSRERFSNEERVKISRAVLMFLNKVNCEHLKAYLNEEQYNVVQTWKLP